MAIDEDTGERHILFGNIQINTFKIFINGFKVQKYSKILVIVIEQKTFF